MFGSASDKSNYDMVQQIIGSSMIFNVTVSCWQIADCDMSVLHIVVLQVLHLLLLFLAVPCFIVQPAQKWNMFTTYMQQIAFFRHAHALKKLVSLAFHFVIWLIFVIYITLDYWVAPYWHINKCYEVLEISALLDH